VDEPVIAEETLDRLGFAPFRALFAEYAAAGLEPARVIRTIRGHVWVASASGVARALPAGSLTSGAEPSTFPVVGDWVAIRSGDATATPVVEAVLPRGSFFARRDPGKATVEQVLAANVDVVFVVDGLDRGPNLRRIERELALAWESGATPVVVLSKADVCEDTEAAIAAVRAIAPGVDVLTESARSGQGFEELLTYTSGDRTVALIGPSGAGKSTLANRLVGGDLQEVGEVRAFDKKGRHTTVTRELVPLPRGGALVDTPGLRSIGMWDDEDGVDTTFAEITELAAGCKFDDCTHVSEPGCAVRAAVESGALDAGRYEAFLALRRESEFVALQSDIRARATDKGKAKSLAKARREFNQNRPGQ
jgi:ribosome biogenesis GTPase